MKTEDTNDMTNKEKLETVFRLLNPRERKYYKREDSPLMQEVTFEVTDNGELRYIISCLLRTCILALDSENDFASPRLSNCSKDLTIATVLDLVDSILPDAQLASYDSIEKLLLTKNKD
ncbi:hypothetical protein APS56_04695 [Pseudalgibacter alginicilyticus]|uniref:Uncharacterized protein n=1 Tax=Pseudalgibacter alginicilyticus TaxID=1736674 RepID=A0A0P0CJF5_9FLAO|nr:hypothetical protein [Pseudalgibacter alginicilyticus]ALJ04480.1 hypothetical protein APS56_04695 [Pseudalgibacter alginicilyticus]